MTFVEEESAAGHRRILADQSEFAQAAGAVVGLDPADERVLARAGVEVDGIHHPAWPLNVPRDIRSPRPTAPDYATPP